jgi:hypothetical protein
MSKKTETVSPSDADLFRGRSTFPDGRRKRVVPSFPAKLDYENDRTKQEFKDECDLSKVVANWLRHGDASIDRKSVV